MGGYGRMIGHASRAAALLALLAVVLPAGPARGAGGVGPPRPGVSRVPASAVGTSQDIASALVLQPDGKLVAAGDSCLSACDFALARYLPDGSLDASFG